MNQIEPENENKPPILAAIEQFYAELGPLFRPTYPNFTLERQVAGQRLLWHRQGLCEALLVLTKTPGGIAAHMLTYVLAPAGGVLLVEQVAVFKQGASWADAQAHMEAVLSRRLLLELVVAQRTFRCRFGCDRPAWVRAIVGDRDV